MNQTYKRRYVVMDELQRRRWQNPEKILFDIGVKPGSIFVDIGCGTGFFAVPAARIIGEKGLVYGLDEDKNAIGVLKKKAAEQQLANLRLEAGEAENTILCHECADIVFLSLVLHDFRDAFKVLANAHRMMKPSGKLVNLDWEKQPMPIGPPLRIRFSSEEAKNLIETAGFKIQNVQKSGPYHYLIIAHPQYRSDRF